MTAIQIIFTAWTLHAFVGATLATPIILLSKKRAHWPTRSIFAFVFPFIVWLVLMLMPLSSGQKSLSNAFAEPVFLGATIAIAAAANALVGLRFRKNYTIVSGILLLCLAAAGIFFLTPALPE